MASDHQQGVSLAQSEAPVRQEARPNASDVGGFEVGERGTTRVFSPVLDDGKLVEDVAHQLLA